MALQSMLLRSEQSAVTALANRQAASGPESTFPVVTGLVALSNGEQKRSAGLCGECSCTIASIGGSRRSLQSRRATQSQALRTSYLSTNLRNFSKCSPSRDGVVRLNQCGNAHRISAMATTSKDPVTEWILGEGGATKVLKTSSVGGGCINVAYKYDTDAGPFFVKSNRSTGPAMFEAEAAGLEQMWETKTIRVPKPLKVGALPGGGSYIIMEFIEFGSRSSQADLGRALGEMHKASMGQSPHGFGFFMDNTIGSTHQPNKWTPDWVDFFREHRLGFQLDLARRQYAENTLYEKGQKLLAKLPELLGGVAVQPVLLHGDLWSGNVASDKEGRPVILDPACYYGHSEAEFGMSWCAGFNSSFYEAYHKIVPREPGFERRVEIYKLYHYLNHLNLFGSGYRGSCLSIIDKFV